ncbi:MAG: type II toxin-antitoxin system HicB family antitoxin [Actinomycetes bacterium]
MKFLVTVDRDEDGAWVAECPAILGCVSQGGSREEAVESIGEAIVLCLEARAERGLPLTIETRRIEVAM